jgi:hypothetical protein
MMSKEPFEIKPVDALPSKSFPKKSAVYDQLIKALENRVVGNYEISIPGKKPSTTYQALASRLKGKELMKLHKFGSKGNEKIYIEILTKPQKKK